MRRDLGFVLLVFAGWLCLLWSLYLILDGLGIDVEVWYGILLGGIGLLLLRIAGMMSKALRRPSRTPTETFYPLIDNRRMRAVSQGGGSRSSSMMQLLEPALPPANPRSDGGQLQALPDGR